MNILERTWNVRGYELDQDSLVAPAHLLRYMEQLRWESMSPDSKLRIDRIFDPGSQFFVVAAQRLEIAADLGLGTRLWASLGIGRVGRTSMEFRNIFRLEHAGGEVVARGSVVAVFLGEDRRPTPLPEELREEALAVRQEQWPGGELASPPTPRRTPPAGAWQREIVVRPSDQDLLGHVNHANYLAYIDDTRRLCLAAGGYDDGPAAGRLRSATIDYLQEARQGQRLRALTWREPSGELCFVLQAPQPDGSTPSICRAAVRV